MFRIDRQTRPNLHFTILVWLIATAAGAQESKPTASNAAEEVAATQTPESVDIEPTAEDVDIESRLTGILDATRWFDGANVRVEQGVAFLEGSTSSVDHKEWAGRLANKTQDVVAVVNRIQVVRPSLLDFTAARNQLREIARSGIQAAPTVLVALVMLLVAWLLSHVASFIARRVANKRVSNPLLRGVIAKSAAIPVLLIGAYLALKVTGLTGLAATVLGGTGLLGIVIGIAFRDIAENFLASILISTQRPFQSGDLVRINDHHGFVQAVTTRGTQLMTLDGNHVQIPNADVYKSVIENQSANPNVRLSFVVGVDYADSSAEAQTSILSALKSHDAVLADPEPLVLVEALASSTVNLRVYFWIDGEVYSDLKVRSAILRRVKRRLQQDGFTLPDEAREMIFPQGVPVKLQGQTGESLDSPVEVASEGSSKPPTKSEESNDEQTEAEGGLCAEKEEISEQAAGSRSLDGATDLLANQPDQ